MQGTHKLGVCKVLFQTTYVRGKRGKAAVRAVNAGYVVSPNTALYVTHCTGGVQLVAVVSAGLKNDARGELISHKPWLQGSTATCCKV